jgi:peptide chain release factor 2
MEKNTLFDRVQSLDQKLEQVIVTLDLEAKKKIVAGYDQQMLQPDFWSDTNNAQIVSQKAADLKNFINTWTHLITGVKDFPELLAMADETERAELEPDLLSLEKIFAASQTELLLSDEHDTKNVILSIHTGNGGQDAEDFSQMLLRMYLRFVEQRGWKVLIIDESPSDAGIKSARLEIKGRHAYGYMKSEHGVHRLIRLSPFNAKSLRQTSFSRIEILPKIETNTELELDPSDIRIDVYRSSGAGGQSVNTTDSAVRVTYLPLNIVVTCQNQRSQLQNKDTAMSILRSKLLKLKLEQQAESMSDLRGDMIENSFGSQIRTYTLQPYKLVKDHRTDTEHNNPDKVFDGDLDSFMEAFLRKKNS